MDFGAIIIGWYERNKRDLPWRNTRNPYFIWLSEIILQQTRVDQGLDYYKRIVKAFPSLKKLASAREEAILKLWQGLGYYSRARNLHTASKQIAINHMGKFPKTYDEILSLKGVGEYTAAAIASFAYNLPYAVVDGNVYRLLSRYLGIKTPVNSSKAGRLFREAAQELLAGYTPRDFNQAIMEFGAKQCKPVNPDCEKCPLNNSCIAFEKSWVSKLPMKSKKSIARPRYFNYLHITNGEYVLMNKRTNDDIWKNLYEFPLIESGKKLPDEKLLKEVRRKQILKGKFLLNRKLEFKHQLSHQTIYASFYQFSIPGKAIPHGGFIRIRKNTIEKLPVHRLMEKYLESVN